MFGCSSCDSFHRVYQTAIKHMGPWVLVPWKIVFYNDSFSHWLFAVKIELGNLLDLWNERRATHEHNLINIALFQFTLLQYHIDVSGNFRKKICAELFEKVTSHCLFEVYTIDELFNRYLHLKISGQVNLGSLSLSHEHLHSTHVILDLNCWISLFEQIYEVVSKTSIEIPASQVPIVADCKGFEAGIAVDVQRGYTQAATTQIEK